jgi:hypothetical protein
MRAFAVVLAALLALSAAAFAGSRQAPYEPREGDFVFQSLPASDLVKAIEGASGSPYSHVGLVMRKADGWYVREAIGPVVDTPLHPWIARGRYGRPFDAPMPPACARAGSSGG